ncbi:MAG: hypothetical protein KKA60_03465 [Proteobacteria bacterium]|nr:hypothetical protein [Pseudomonadota bacterium]
MRRLLVPAALAALVACFFLTGCAHHFAVSPVAPLTVIRGQGGTDALGERFAPAFLVYESGRPGNLMGEPRARLARDGGPEVYVDPERPVVYFLKREFSTDKGRYTNLIYRVHFPEIPFSLVPFNLTAGKNAGLLVVITLDADERPVLVTTVHTCGCYKAFTPTDLLPAASLPEGWEAVPAKVYGETLPPMAGMGKFQDPVLVVHLRPGVHRVMDLSVAPESGLAALAGPPVAAPLVPMSRLDHLALDNGETSFFHDSGIMEGFVKGSIKPWETLFMSWAALDLFVGTDKRYADPKETGNPFYTSLKPWRREDSDMWDFARFLRYWGWRL